MNEPWLFTRRNALLSAAVALIATSTSVVVVVADQQCEDATQVLFDENEQFRQDFLSLSQELVQQQKETCADSNDSVLCDHGDVSDVYETMVSDCVGIGGEVATATINYDCGEEGSYRIENQAFCLGSACDSDDLVDELRKIGDGISFEASPQSECFLVFSYTYRGETGFGHGGGILEDNSSLGDDANANKDPPQEDSNNDGMDISSGPDSAAVADCQTQVEQLFEANPSLQIQTEAVEDAIRVHQDEKCPNEIVCDVGDLTSFNAGLEEACAKAGGMIATSSISYKCKVDGLPEETLFGWRNRAFCVAPSCQQSDLDFVVSSIETFLNEITEEEACQFDASYEFAGASSSSPRMAVSLVLVLGSVLLTMLG